MLVRSDQVLDVTTLSVECGRWQQPTICNTQSETQTMIDPGALGTLLIGLDHVQDEHGRTDRPEAARTVRARRDGRLARRLAASLRRLAEAIEPTPRPRDLGLEG
jgi:hypothetical protein